MQQKRAPDTYLAQVPAKKSKMAANSTDQGKRGRKRKAEEKVPGFDKVC